MLTLAPAVADAMKKYTKLFSDSVMLAGISTPIASSPIPMRNMIKGVSVTAHDVLTMMILKTTLI